MGVFRMPSLGSDMEAGTLAEWLVKPGDAVKRGDVVAVVETQKGAIEIEVFEEGTVAELTAEVGQTLPVGAPMAVLLAEGEGAPRKAAEASAEKPREEVKPAPPPVAPVPDAPPPPTPAAARAASGAAAVPPGRASPAARVRAHELGVDLATVKGTGPGGVIVLGDVEARAGGEAPKAPPAGMAQPPEPARKPSAPMEEMRKAIAAAMTRAKQTIPHFYVSQTIDVTGAAEWVAARNAGRPPAERLLLGAVFVRAASRAAAEVGAMNGHYVDGALRPSGKVNMGVAVALRGGGLVAPALMDAGAMSLEETMAGMRDLVTRARAGRLRSSEMTEGTITLSSLGETGAEAMTGVIFPPQVALVGLGAPHVRPWVVGGEVVPRSVVTLTLSADHRVSDGRQAARFIAAFEDHVARPEEP